MAQLLKIQQRLVKLFNVFLLCLAMLSTSCNNQNAGNSNDNIRSQGNFNSRGLEINNWKYFNKNGEIIEEGFFKEGIRIGRWNYYSPKTESIFWKKFSDKSSRIETNVPTFLNLSEKNDNLVVFKNNDTSKIFNLVFGKGFTNDFSSYKLHVYEDLKKLRVEISDTLNEELETSEGKKYLYNYILGRDSLGKAFNIFNIVGVEREGDVIEITLRCETTYADKGRKVFFSVIPNFFIDSVRFLDERDNILIRRN